MKTRMQKYYDEDTQTLLRQQKNEHLYDNMENLEDIDYKIENNATILQNNATNIDVEHIKRILDNRYKEAPKRRSIVVEEPEEDHSINLDETREYDINTILQKARSEKEDNYERERVKKLRDTQFDILTSLDIEGEKTKSEPKESKESNELMDLINTITARELITKENKKTEQEDMDPLDILTELKGDDNTIVVGASKESESIGETSPIMSLEEADKIKPLIMEEEKKKDLTSTLQFTQSDFDDFNDLKKEVKSSRALIYITIVIISLILIGGIIIFLNNFLNLNWF